MTSRWYWPAVIFLVADLTIAAWFFFSERDEFGGILFLASAALMAVESRRSDYQ